MSSSFKYILRIFFSSILATNFHVKSENLNYWVSLFMIEDKLESFQLILGWLVSKNKKKNLYNLISFQLSFISTSLLS